MVRIENRFWGPTQLPLALNFSFVLIQLLTAILEMASLAQIQWNFEKKLEVALDAELVETATFNQWESADRCDIITKTTSTDDFIAAFWTRWKP